MITVSTTMVDKQPAMIKPEWLEAYSRVAIIGLGVTGFSVLDFLKKFDLELLVLDTRADNCLLAKAKEQAEDAAATIEYAVGDKALDDLSTVDLMIVSPGVSIKTPAIAEAIANGVEFSGDIDILGRHVDLPVLAITGSNGKSTVVTLVGELLKAAGMKPFVGGNIGLPALYIFENRQDYDVVVLELSSFQLETTENLNLISSVNLNVSPDHLDRYDSYAEYAASKGKIHALSSHCVVNRDDENTLLGINSESERSSFGFEPKSELGEKNVYSIIDGYVTKQGKPLMAVSEVNMIGSHNLMNVLAALALIEPLDIDFSVCEEVLKTFSGLSHRTQKVAEIDGVVWVNDSKATNVGACQAALEGIDGEIILIAGGQGKGGEFSSLKDTLNSKVKAALLFGQDADVLLRAWSQSTSCESVDGMEQAVKRASQLAKTGDTVLLSPACASFDMYSGFAARGDHFVQQVEALQ